jgi:tetratricopeptide (TPR) repeat protein
MVGFKSKLKSDNVKNFNRLKKLIKFDQLFSANQDSNLVLEKAGLTRDELINLSIDVGANVIITSNSTEMFESVADFLMYRLYEYKSAIRIYFEIINVHPLRASVYKKMLNIYNHDFAMFYAFDFFGNINKSVVKECSIDSIYLCISCNYLGQLLQRLGRFNEASAIYELGMVYHSRLPEICKFLYYGIEEILFLRNIYNQHKIFEGATSSKPLLLIGVVFFGEEYLNLFCRAAAPSFFCDNNLSIINKKWDPRLVIFTSKKDINKLETSLVYSKLTLSLNVKIIIIPDGLMDNHPDNIANKYSAGMFYSLSGLVQTSLFLLAKIHNADLINLTPDVLYSKSCMHIIDKAISNGFEIVFTPGIRLKREDVLQSLFTKYSSEDLLQNGLTLEELTEIALRNLHSATESCFLSNEKVTYPGILIWPISAKGLFLHAFQMHPIFISGKQIEKSNVRRFDSIDGDFVQGIIPNRKEWQHLIYVTSEAAEIVMFELSGGSVVVDRKFNTNKLIKEAGGWISTYMKPLNFWLFQKRVRIGFGVSNKDIEKHADLLLKEAYKLECNLKFINEDELNSKRHNQRQDLSILFDPIKVTNIPPVLESLHIEDNRLPRFKSEVVICFKRNILKLIKRLFEIIPASQKRSALLTAKKLAIKHGGIFEKFFYEYQKNRAIYNEI